MLCGCFWVCICVCIYQLNERNEQKEHSRLARQTELTWPLELIGRSEQNKRFRQYGLNEQIQPIHRTEQIRQIGHSTGSYGEENKAQCAWQLQEGSDTEDEASEELINWSVLALTLMSKDVFKVIIKPNKFKANWGRIM